MADYRGTTAVTCLDGATSLYAADWQKADTLVNAIIAANAGGK